MCVCVNSADAQQRGNVHFAAHNRHVGERGIAHIKRNVCVHISRRHTTEKTAKRKFAHAVFSHSDERVCAQRRRRNSLSQRTFFLFRSSNRHRRAHSALPISQRNSLSLSQLGRLYQQGRHFSFYSNNRDNRAHIDSACSVCSVKEEMCIS